MKKVLILNYHNISQNASKDSLYTIDPSIFKKHLNLIKDLKIPVKSMEDLTDNSLTENYSLLLSFDDGYKSDLTEVLPLLQEHQFPAIFFPIIAMIGQSDRLSWEDLKIISKKGFEIGSHGISHNILTDLTLTELETELKDSKSLIEQQINVPVKHFALPYGTYNAKLLELAKQFNYKTILTTGLRSNSIDENSFLLYRWNITSDITLESLNRILQTNGSLPFSIRLTFSIKRIVKRILGTELTEKLIRKYKNG